MNSEIRLSLNSTSTDDPLNHGRIEEDETQSILVSSVSRYSKKSNKYLAQQTDPFDHRQSFTSLILQTPQMHKSAKKKLVDLTKTMTIKGKKGKLYEDVCPVCLTTYSTPIGVLSCRHKFCFQCISVWAKTSTICPCCREKFNQIIKKTKDNEGTVEIIKVQEKQMVFREEDYFICYVCGQGDHQHVLLVCDMCDFYCCHIFCDPALNNTIPEGDWFCRHCQPNAEHHLNNPSQIDSVSSDSEKDEEEKEQNKPVAARTRSHNFESGVEVLRRLRQRR